ncbi:MAG TPA: phosphatidate cytidylyltransferase [Opitutaceae bacterium]|nr:phosphatidate cytidylyltransferase [Opitutaceae bacterium]
MTKRIFSTVGLWTLVLLCVHFFGTIGGVWLVTAISVLTLREFYAMVKRMGPDPFDRFGLTLAAALTLGPCYLPQYARPDVLLALAVLVFSIRILGEREPHNRVETLAWSLFGVIYVPFMLQFMVRILMFDEPRTQTGLVLTIWLIAVSKFCDVGALLTGLAIGRHKMTPNISPKKTWEGAAGGVLVSAGIGATLAWTCRAWLPSGLTPVVGAAMALPIAGLAIVSDLIESIIKRRAGTKDAGQTIPGIGGVFDLSDSLILTAPVGYVLFSLL